MTDFPYRPALAMLQLVVDDDACGQSGAEIQKDRGPFFRSLGDAGSAKGGDIHVVLDTHRQSEPTLQHRTQIVLADAKIDDIADMSRLRIDLTGDADTDHRELGEKRAGHLTHQSLDIGYHLIAALTGRKPTRRDNGAFVRQQNSLYLRSTDIDADNIPSLKTCRHNIQSPHISNAYDRKIFVKRFFFPFPTGSPREAYNLHHAISLGRNSNSLELRSGKLTTVRCETPVLLTTQYHPVFGNRATSHSGFEELKNP